MPMQKPPTPPTPKNPPPRESPPQRRDPSPNIQDTDHRANAPAPHNAPHGADPRKAGVDPGAVPPLVRPTETLPTDPHAGKPQTGEPVGLARHAETEDEVERLDVMEHSKVPPPGSRNYVAGQPVNEEEYERTEAEANRLAEAGRAQRTEAEQLMKENTPGDPDYHPADPDHRDTPQAQGQDRDKRAPSEQPGHVNPKPGEHR